MMQECQFDGLVGPTHNYAGLSEGNLASSAHRDQVSSPRGAAEQGLAKMRLVRNLGVPQAVLPPQQRPSLPFLHRLGFRGSDEQVLARAAHEGGGLYLRLASSASAMWTANAATSVPSCDAADGRMHLAVANLARMPHRALEPDATLRLLRAVFADRDRFAVHPPLPSSFADEGAANHTCLRTSRGALHLFASGRRLHDEGPEPTRLPARQTREASESVARLASLPPSMCRFPVQDPRGIEAGAFHTDVLAVGSGRLLLLHELAFADGEALVADLRRELGEELIVVRAAERDLPASRAVAAYPFNSQCLWLPGGRLVIVAPSDAREDAASYAFLSRVVERFEGARLRAELCFVDLRQSMRNGGGPACLRLRIPLTPDEMSAIAVRVRLDDALDEALARWIARHYRDRLTPRDLADPALHREAMTALDELTTLLALGDLYDFQRARDAGDSSTLGGYDG